MRAPSSERSTAAPRRDAASSSRSASLRRKPDHGRTGPGASSRRPALSLCGGLGLDLGDDAQELVLQGLGDAADAAFGPGAEAEGGAHEVDDAAVFAVAGDVNGEAAGIAPQHGFEGQAFAEVEGVV